MLKVRVEGLDYLEEAVLKLMVLQSMLRRRGLGEESALFSEILGLLDAHKKELEELRQVQRLARMRSLSTAG